MKDPLTPDFLKNPLLFIGFQFALTYNSFLLRVLYPAGIIGADGLFNGCVNLLRFTPDPKLRPNAK